LISKRGRKRRGSQRKVILQLKWQGGGDIIKLLSWRCKNGEQRQTQRWGKKMVVKKRLLMESQVGE